MKISNKHTQWFQNTQKIAHISGGRYNMVALLVKGNRILNMGVNYYPIRKAATHPLYKGMGTHAEVEAIKETTTDGAILYVAGFTEYGTPICSKPCGRCSLLLRESNIRAIVYLNSQYRLEIMERVNLQVNIKHFFT